jgi:hypothetical protein
LWRNKEGRKSRADQAQAPPQRRSTIRIEFGNDTCEEHKIKINKVVRSKYPTFRVADVVCFHGSVDGKVRPARLAVHSSADGKVQTALLEC